MAPTSAAGSRGARGSTGSSWTHSMRRRWTLVPSAEFYPGATNSPFRLNADLKFHPPTVYGFFYLGGGFAYLHSSGFSDAGANLFAGWEGRRARPFKPFLEGKFVFADNTSFNVEAGLNFPL